jgi:rfaE bifunctional protein nucleotidyltransferase chain/domain
MVIAQHNIELWCEKLRQQNKKIIFTNGCFDILHAGHVRYLESAKALGDCLVIGLNSDASVRALKGESRPINSEEDRAEVLGALRAVDCVVVFGDETAGNLIAKVRPDVYVKGGDYTVETLPEAKIVLGYGGKIEFIPLVTGRSSSNIINKIKLTEEK